MKFIKGKNSKENYSNNNNNYQYIGRIIKNVSLPNNFYQKIFEAENNFQSNSSFKNCKELLSYYKLGSEYYNNKNNKLHSFFLDSIQKTISIQMSSKNSINKLNHNNTNNINNINIQEIINNIKNKNNTSNNDNININININNFQNNLNINNRNNITNKKKHWNPLVKSHLRNYNLHEYDFKFKAKKIINEFNKSIDNSINFLKKYNQKQENSFRENIEKKIFKTRLENNSDNYYNSNKNKPQKKRKSLISISSLNLLKNNFQSVEENSPIRGRKLSYSNKKMKSNLLLNERNIYNQKGKKKDLTKQDLSNNIINFLKNYNNKLYYLFQTPLNESFNKLNYIFDDSYSEMKNKYFEFEEDLKGYISLSENLEDEGIKNLITSLKKDFEEEIMLIKSKQDNKINSLINEMVNTNLMNNISICNLNSDTIAQIAELFK